MDLRSDYILGKDFFVKVVNLDNEDSDRLEKAMKDGQYVPFTSVEFLITYILEKKRKDLLSPKTEVFTSEKIYTIENFKNIEYYEDLTKNMKNLGFANTITKKVKTAVIISERLEGNLDAFIRTSPSNKDLEDAFIHISWLYFEYQKLTFCTHGDPKPANYTWKVLNVPVDIVYDFRDSFDNSEKRQIKRTGVKNLFYFTDLEFAHSPFTIVDQNKYYNFTKIYEFIDDSRKDIIYYPKLSSEPYYDYNTNLYGGYEQKILKYAGDMEERFGLFPRLFTIDLLTLIKTILTYDYSRYLSPEIHRKFNLYFTRFLSLSEDYIKASPASLAIMLST